MLTFGPISLAVFYTCLFVVSLIYNLFLHWGWCYYKRGSIIKGGVTKPEVLGFYIYIQIKADSLISDAVWTCGNL